MEIFRKRTYVTGFEKTRLPWVRMYIIISLSTVVLNSRNLEGITTLQ